MIIRKIKSKLVAKKPSAKAVTEKPALRGNVKIEFLRPEAKQVSVAGSFNQWTPGQTLLAPDGKGKWVGSLTLPAGRHEYLLVVDGQWLPDPNAADSAPNPYGGINSVLSISA